MRIVCFGPGPKFKGGISNYNTALAKALDRIPGVEVHIVSWTQQYPSIVPREFIDNRSKTNFLAGTNVRVHYATNYNNPLTWQKTYHLIRSLRPDKVIFQWAIAVQGIPLGWISKRLQRHRDIEVIFDLHFVTQKEGSRLDDRFTRMGLKHADTYVVHAFKTADELKTLFADRHFEVSHDGERSTDRTTIIKLFHPIYDLFQPKADFDVHAFKERMGLRKTVFLFFGFIRKYKGLHYAIEAFSKVAAQREDISLLICGESFWKTLDTSKWSTRWKQALFTLAKRLFMKPTEDERNYDPLASITELQLEDRTVVVNEFIANEDVHKYFQASDAVVLFYEYATPSGIESLSYNFSKPLLATRVGHFPETIVEGENGYLAEPADINSMAQQMIRFLDRPIHPENVVQKTKEMSWKRYASSILYDL